MPKLRNSLSAHFNYESDVFLVIEIIIPRDAEVSDASLRCSELQVRPASDRKSAPKLPSRLHKIGAFHFSLRLPFIVLSENFIRTFTRGGLRPTPTL